jgi:hypothetical protein
MTRSRAVKPARGCPPARGSPHSLRRCRARARVRPARSPSAEKRRRQTAQPVPAAVLVSREAFPLNRWLS